MQHTSDIHMALNHAHTNGLRRSMKDQLKFIGTPPVPVHLIFSGLHVVKMSRQTHIRNQNNYDVGVIIFSDVCWPMSTQRNMGELYLLTVTDIASSYCFLFPITSTV